VRLMLGANFRAGLLLKLRLAVFRCGRLKLATGVKGEWFVLKSFRAFAPVATAAIAVASISGVAFAFPSPASTAQPQQAGQPGSQTGIARQVGTVKEINGNTLTLAQDSGTNVNVVVLDATKIVSVAPGQTDLKSAIPIRVTDLHPGDRVVVRGVPSEDGKSFLAAGIIAMSSSNVAAKQAQDRRDWQKRGIGGLVSSVDPGSGTVTISAGGPGSTKTIAIKTAKNTILRRYAPNSVSFDDAAPAPLDRIKVGDQLRARGTKSSDGSEFSADEIVSGSFRNIAGTVSSVDTSAGSISLMDLISKKAVVVKITNQSQLRKLPPELAQRIAFRLRAAAAGAQGGAASGQSAGANQLAVGGGGQSAASATGAGRPGGGAPEFQQMVNRIPAASLADFQKGDVVMVVSTEGADVGGVTAITLLGGVEPILAAAPSGSQAMNLLPWSLGAGGADTGTDNP
jgi:hypothetical protein